MQYDGLIRRPNEARLRGKGGPLGPIPVRLVCDNQREPNSHFTGCAPAARIARRKFLGCLLGLAAAASAPPAGAVEKSPPPRKADRMALLKTFVSEFVEITPGKGKFPKTFRMGSADGRKSERPVHEVTLARPFAIAKYEVPQNLYEAVMGENPSRWKGPRNSAEMMTFKDAHTFCRKVTIRLREAKLIGKDEEIRLPTEAEWEYCCRAGTTTAYGFGDEARKPGDRGKQASLLDAYAWHTGNAAGNDPPVGALKPNAWGLYDMHGYLWEFVSDDWHEHYDGAPQDGRSWQEKTAEGMPIAHVARGGSWKDRYDRLRSATRRRIPPETKDDAIGFRCVRATVQ